VSLALLHARVATITLLRHPSFAVPTLGFPAMFFLFFASPARGLAATYALCSFAAFAAIGVAFFQFGVGIAAERGSPWESYVRTLPASPTARLVARLLSASLFATLSAAIVIVAALLTTNASLSAGRWAELALALALGVVPFALLGIALGYWATPRGALPLANILYLGLSYGGGLWIRPGRLPSSVEAVAPYLPTRHLASILVGVVAGSPWRGADWAALAGFAIVFAAAALLGYRRDEGQRFR
jgi:ABC-2 type transport system permease protein